MAESSPIRHSILVASGKGGVGKSTIAAHLALALAARPLRVGLLDADVYGPSVPTLLGAAPRPTSLDGKTMVPPERHGIKVMSIGYLVPRDQAMIWRGPMLAGAVAQMVTDVAWGELDAMVFDLPPGTGDIQLTLAQKFQISGAVLVTTPQELALADVVRAKAMFDRVRIPVLGVIENMSAFVCPGCGAAHEIFSAGGGARAAAELNVQFLGGVPLEPAVVAAGDRGEPIFSAAPESASARALSGIADVLWAGLEARERAQARGQARKRGLPIIRQ